MTNIYAALEIGTTRTVLAVGEAETGGRLRITAHAETPSVGVRKSQVTDIAQTTQSIRNVLKHIGQRADGKPQQSTITIGNAFLIVSGQHVKVTSTSSSVPIGRDKVRDEEIKAVFDHTRMIPIPKDRELLDIADQDYAIDGRGGIVSPKGMSGGTLQLNILQIHAEANRINDARSAAEDARLEIREPLFAATCAADAVLDDTERREGVLLLDLGGGSTGYAVYSDGYLADAGVIGVGGDHVTNDIATAFQTTQQQAETLKINDASAVLSPEDNATARVSIAGSSTLAERTISRRALDTVVNARVRELLKIIRTTLEENDLLHRLHSGVVITGGGAALKGIDLLISRELGLNVRIGRPIGIDGLDAEPHNESFAAIAGALIYAHRNYEEKPILDSILRKFFK